MSCPAFEERIARYVGGDLSAEEVQAVEQHLRICAVCAELARGLEADREWLSQRPSEVAEVDYAAMRRRIREEIGHSHARLRWLPALLAAAAILLAVVLPIHRPAPRKMLPVQKAETAAAQLPPTPLEVHPVRHIHPRRHIEPQPQPEFTLEAAMRMYRQLNPEPPPPPEASDSPVEMRIATRDPNVTIILVQESNGDSQ